MRIYRSNPSIDTIMMPFIMLIRTEVQNHHKKRVKDFVLLLPDFARIRVYTAPLVLLSCIDVS